MATTQTGGDNPMHHSAARRVAHLYSFGRDRASRVRHPAEEPEIRVRHVSLDFRPDDYTDRDGQPIGFSVDLIKAVAKAMGLRLHFVTGPWDQVWKGLATGSVDVLPT